MKMTRLSWSLLVPVLMLSASSIRASNTDSAFLPLPNPGFESGLIDWIVNEDKAPMSTAHPDAARTGERGLRVIDESEKEGSSVATRRLPVEPGRAYRLAVHARIVSGGGMAVYLRFFDAKGKHLNPWPKATDNAAIQSPNWREYTVTAAPPEGAIVLDAWIHSYGGSKVVADFDDVSIEAFIPRIEPPWPSVYKINPANPADAARLTPSDVVGPDGLVYPNWKYVGIPGGIPQKSASPVVVGPETFAAHAGRDIAPLLNEAVRRAAAQGGGAVELPAGTFLLESPVIVRDSGVTIRGAGRDRTRLIYQEHIPFGTLRLHCWNPNGRIGPDSFWEIQTNPKNLTLMRVTATDQRHGKNDKIVLMENIRKDHWGNRFSTRLRGALVLETLGPGRHQIEAEVGYSTGESFKKTFEIDVAATPQPGDTWADQHGAFIIAGPGLQGPRLPLASTARRGDNRLQLAPNHGLKPGDHIMIEAPATDRWNKLTGNVTPWGTYRINHYEITAVAGSSITIADPLRLEFPWEDGSYVQRIGVVSRSGFEGFTVEQKIFTPSSEFTGPRIQHTLWYPMEDLWADGVTFAYAWRCWLRDVRVVNSGRNPIYITRSKQCEIRDVEADGAIFKGGGGTGYVGFERSFDCLMDGALTKDMRHAPNVQWGSAGNVIRNGHFIGSDAQWHAGWTNENLYENNIIEQTAADRTNGAYGHAFFASGPASSSHGPQGPRNVVYNNDVSAPKDGVHMVGGNEAWLILHNRFRLGQGRAIYGKEKSFDHTIRGNVFIMEKPDAVAVLFGSADCTGIDVMDNQFYGPLKTITGFSGGLGDFGIVSGNKLHPKPAASELPPRPQPAVPSIYEWQRERKIRN
ncbi:endopolygalacturonase [Opitutaceae bacterium TAV4]|nr:endopolygalacturonase [Opitutaceae bacterium TAV4]RRK00233.1 endopolygalacturonase [Opitutaceae bacterium TAV3]